MTLSTILFSWNYGNVIHNGNALLGRIALREGNPKDAAALLLRAGRSPGSPQLNSFGPDFVLASELLKADEPAAVLEYLEHVGKFLKIPELERWREDIRAGRAPQGFRWPQ